MIEVEVGVTGKETLFMLGMFKLYILHNYSLVSAASISLPNSESSSTSNRLDSLESSLESERVKRETEGLNRGEWLMLAIRLVQTNNRIEDSIRAYNHYLTNLGTKVEARQAEPCSNFNTITHNETLLREQLTVYYCNINASHHITVSSNSYSQINSNTKERLLAMMNDVICQLSGSTCSQAISCSDEVVQAQEQQEHIFGGYYRILHPLGRTLFCVLENKFYN